MGPKGETFVAIPPFREDGYLPEGLHVATEEETLARFAQTTARRRYLAWRLRRWLELARTVGAERFFVNGSFVTSKDDPHDIDAVVWTPRDFAAQVQEGRAEATELLNMLVTRQPEELFAVRCQMEWEGWVAFFSHAREPDGRRKGLVEVLL